MCEDCEKILKDLKGKVKVVDVNSADMSEDIALMLFKAAAVKIAETIPEEVLDVFSVALLSVLVTNIKKLDDINKFQFMKDGIKEFSELTIDRLEKEKDEFETFIAKYEATSSSKH